MLSSVGSWLTAGVEAVAEKVGADIKLDDQYNDKEQEESGKREAQEEAETGKEAVVNDDQADDTSRRESLTTTGGGDGIGTTSSDLQLPIWEQAPKQLCSHRDEWKTAILGLMQDENTFIISLKRLQEEKEGTQWTSLYTQLNCTSGELEEKLANKPLKADTALHVERVQKMLIADQLPDFNHLRYKISPHFVLDEHFWRNFSDKLCAVSLAPNIPALLEAMEVMNTEPNPVPEGEKRKRNVGVANNSAIMQQVRDAVNAKTILADWIAKKKETSLEFLKAGRNSYSMLASLLGKRGHDEAGDDATEELLESVAESCKYHKTKIGGIVGELSAPGTPEKLQGSGLEPEGGEIMEQLLSLNQDLHSALDAFSTKTPMRMKTAVDSYTTPKPGGEGVPSSSAQAEELSHSSPQSTSSTPSGPAVVKTPTEEPSSVPVVQASNNDNNEFNAELPWDDE